jgi:hypothetical protein
VRLYKRKSRGHARHKLGGATSQRSRGALVLLFHEGLKRADTMVLPSSVGSIGHLMPFDRLSQLVIFCLQAQVVIAPLDQDVCGDTGSSNIDKSCSLNVDKCSKPAVPAEPVLCVNLAADCSVSLFDARLCLAEDARPRNRCRVTGNSKGSQIQKLSRAGVAKRGFHGKACVTNHIASSRKYQMTPATIANANAIKMPFSHALILPASIIFQELGLKRALTMILPSVVGSMVYPTGITESALPLFASECPVGLAFMSDIFRFKFLISNSRVGHTLFDTS